MKIKLIIILLKLIQLVKTNLIYNIIYVSVLKFKEKLLLENDFKIFKFKKKILKTQKKIFQILIKFLMK